MQSPLLEQLTVTTACPAKWEQMRGDDRVRYCTLCGEHVYNLREMTDNEVLELMRGTGGRFCGRLYGRGDGTYVTGDCAARQPHRHFQFSLRSAMLLLTGLASLFGLTRFVHQHVETKQQLAEPAQPHTSFEALGMVVAPVDLDALEVWESAPEAEPQE